MGFFLCGAPLGNVEAGRRCPCLSDLLNNYGVQ